MQNREMNIKKRIVSALMALVMTLSLVNSAVITAFAEGTQSADPSTGETQNAGYELRVLTFEDADYKGGTNFAGKSDWSSLIDSPQYGGSMLYGDGSGFDTLEKPISGQIPEIQSCLPVYVTDMVHTAIGAAVMPCPTMPPVIMLPMATSITS